MYVEKLDTCRNEMRSPQIDDAWRMWIAENLLCDSDHRSIYQTLLQKGFMEVDVIREMDAALKSPYVAGATRLKNRLQKRTWALNIFRKLNELDPRSQIVPRRDRLTHQQFFDEYYSLNRPVVITGMMADWPAMKLWDFDYLRKNFGERLVEVQFGRSSDANYEVNQPKLRRQMRFDEYVDLVANSGETNDFYMTANNSSQNKIALAELWNDIREFPEYLESSNPTGGFFWFGPKGTKTPFHHDLTNNFMAQVVGRKRVRLVPTVELGNMYNDLHCYTPVDGGNLDFSRFPMLQHAQMMDVEIGAGEILFLPVGCWHYVLGLEVSITMSFTNFRWDNDFSSFYNTYQAV